MKRISLIATWCLVVMLAAAVTALAASSKAPKVRALAASSKAPTVTGKDLNTAYLTLEKAGLKVTYSGSIELTPNFYCFPKVTGQSVSGKTATLKVSKQACALGSVVGADQKGAYKVPTFVGERLPAAIKWVNEHHLTWQVKHLPGLKHGSASSWYGNYVIASQNPKAGSKLKRGIIHNNGARYTPLTLQVADR